MKIPLVTVYIPSKNYGHYLEEAIESVLCQTLRNWELFIVDEASSDSTKKVAGKYRGEKRIEVLETAGIGLAAVGNLILKKMSGDYLIRLDADDVFDENILHVLVSHMVGSPEIALVFPDYYLMDPFGRVFAQEVREVSGTAVSSSDTPPHGACTMIRRKDLLEAGGYREDTIAQDGLDLWSRPELRKRSKHIGLPLFSYRQHQGSHSSNEERIFGARRKIKSDMISTLPKPVTAVIPCRTNNDFRSNLWSVPIGGISLLERRIEICLRSSHVDQVLVTSDSEEIETLVSERYSNDVQHHRRSTESTFRSVPFTSTLRDVASVVDPESNGLIALGFIQTPFASVQLIEEALATLMLYEADSAWAVEKVSGDLLRRTSAGVESLSGEGQILRDSSAVFRDSKTFTVFRTRNLEDSEIRGLRSVAFEVRQEETFFVNSERNLMVAEFIAKGGANALG